MITEIPTVERKEFDDGYFPAKQNPYPRIPDLIDTKKEIQTPKESNFTDL